jgi:transcriptional regulator with XRE-family HTH domain
VSERGPLHNRLHATLREAWLSKAVTQESLARAIGKSQESVGQYLRATKAGTLDLDEADAALHHIGSSLDAFLATMPPRPLTPTERLARELESRPEMQAVILDLLRVPRPRLGAVLALLRGVLPLAIGPRGSQTDATPFAASAAGRTTVAAQRRRRARGGK